MTHFTDAHPIARKPHTCQYCGRTIRPGETYRRGAGMDGSHAWAWKECAHCEALLLWVITAYDLDEYDAATIADHDPETIAELRLKANWRRKWTRRDGTLVPAPRIIRREDKYGFGHVVGIEGEDS